jgi:hypothetical protein
LHQTREEFVRLDLLKTYAHVGLKLEDLLKQVPRGCIGRVSLILDFTLQDLLVDFVWVILVFKRQ